MLFLVFLFIVILAVALLLFATQVIIPLRRKMPMFPLFRKSTPLKEKIEAAEMELSETEELVALEKQWQFINKRMSQLKDKQ